MRCSYGVMYTTATPKIPLYRVSVYITIPYCIVCYGTFPVSNPTVLAIRVTGYRIPTRYLPGIYQVPNTYLQGTFKVPTRYLTGNYLVPIRYHTSKILTFIKPKFSTEKLKLFKENRIFSILRIKKFLGGFAPPDPPFFSGGLRPPDPPPVRIYIVGI